MRYSLLRNTIYSVLTVKLKHGFKKWAVLSNSKWSSIDSPGDVDANTIYQELLKDVRLGSQVPKPNVVILEAGKEPNADKNIYEACQAYYKDLGLMDEYNLDIWADQAIHSHLVHIKNNEEYSCKLWLGLGQWHTSKAMCSALITLFSSYGLYNCALELGVKYPEKLEVNTDYWSTCNILETMWASTGFCRVKNHRRADNS